MKSIVLILGLSCSAAWADTFTIAIRYDTAFSNDVAMLPAGVALHVPGGLSDAYGSQIVPTFSHLNTISNLLSDAVTAVAGYAAANYQPLNSDLSAIGALTTTAFGRGLLDDANAAAVRTTIGAGTSSFDGAFASLSSKPTTIGGYGITDFNSLGDARWSSPGHSHAAADVTSGVFAIARLGTGTPDGTKFLRDDGTFVTPAVGGAVTSAFGRTGAVIGIEGDYAAFYSLAAHTHAFASLTAVPATVAGHGITDFDSRGDARWAAIAHGHAFAEITATPATVAGYGITDFNSLGDARWSAVAHTHAFASLTAVPTTVAGHGITDFNSLGDARWQLTDGDLTTIAGLTPTTDNFMVAASSAWASRTPAQAKTSLALVKGDVGLGAVDNVADNSKPVSTAQQTALDLKANLASPAFTGTPALPSGTTATTQSAGDNDTSLATTAFATSIQSYGQYKTLREAAGSHIAARVAGTYFLPYGSAIGITGTGTLYPPVLIHIVGADYPTVNGVAPKLRIRVVLAVNDAAPTGNFTFGLYPVTRPSTSGGAGLDIYTMGTVVTGSNGATFTTPAADSMGTAVSSDFALPSDGVYVLGVVTTATVAANSHLHMSVVLQQRNN